MDNREVEVLKLFDGTTRRRLRAHLLTHGEWYSTHRQQLYVRAQAGRSSGADKTGDAGNIGFSCVCLHSFRCLHLINLGSSCLLSCD